MTAPARSAKPNTVLKLWQKLSPLPGGKLLFSKAIAAKAPYFKTISPRFEVLELGRCVVTAKKRRSVHNHIGTFHAIAVCNMAEVAMGILAEVMTPSSHRWIPKTMTVNYLKKAETDLRAVATLPVDTEFAEARDLPIPVEVFDTGGNLVFTAVITVWISPKKR
jgi:acyl-coenzyme A thioesterase PaaI-like protein